MLPVLVQIGPVKIYSYGLMMFLGMFLGLFWWWRLGRDEHLDEVKLFDTGFMAMFGFLIIGRLGYVVARWAEFGSVWKSLALFAYPGFEFWLGVVGAYLAVVIAAKRRNWDEWKILDMLSVSVSVVMIFGSIGGLLNGSNPGIEVVKFGMRYPGQEGLVFPVDLWGVVWFLVMFAVVSRVRKNFRFYQWYKVDQSKVANGLAFLFFVGAVGIYYIVRAVVDDVRMNIGGVPVMLLVGVGAFVFSLVMIYVRSGRSVDDDISSIKIWLGKGKSRRSRRGLKIRS